MPDIIERTIIKIDEDKCIGCGLCATACHEGAIQVIDGKAKLLRDDYCDGLGNCLPVCPTEAITFEKREAKKYNKEVAPKRLEQASAMKEDLPCGCPGENAKAIVRKDTDLVNEANTEVQVLKNRSMLQQWPVQIQLVPENAPYFENANLLIAADCTAFAYGNFHEEFIKNKITLIGCPKLDTVSYENKLTSIIKNNNIKSVTVVRMEVPCCAGIAEAVKNALVNSGKMIPWQIEIISTDGKRLKY